MVWHPAHGGLLLLGLAPVPAGEGQVQFPGGQHRVVIEHLVEITQAEHEDAVIVPGFDILILPLHRRQFCFCHVVILSYSASSPVRLQVVEPVMRRSW